MGRSYLLKPLSFFSFLFLFSSIAFFIGFVFYKAIVSISTGVKNPTTDSSTSWSEYFLSWSHKIAAPNTSIWPPLIYTLLLVFFSVWLTHICAIRFSKFILRARKEVKNCFLLLLKITSILPSFVLSFVIFEAILPKLRWITGSTANFSIIFPIVVFFTAIFPIAVLAYSNWFNSNEIKQLNSALLSLSLTSKWREKLYPKLSRRIIYITLAAALTKALGESVAFKWFLTSDSWERPFSSLRGFLSSQSHTISSLISEFYFSEGGGKKNREAMFIYGSALLIFSFLIHTFLMKKGSNVKFKNTLTRKKYNWLKFKVLSFLEKAKASTAFCYFAKYALFSFHGEEWNKKEFEREKGRKKREKFFLYFYISIFLAIVVLIILRGEYFILLNIARGYTYETYNPRGLWIPLGNTLIVLFFSISWSLPICFFAAFFLSIYLHKWKRIKYILSGFISGCGATPPMLWAMFGSLIFLNYLKLGLSKVSIFGGILTLTVLNFPFLFSRCFNLCESYLKKYSVQFTSLGMHPSSLFSLIMKSGIEKIRLFIAESITRLNSESGLLWITAGASPQNRLTLWGPGQTFTTKIFTSLLKYNVTDLKSIVYETIFFLFWLSLFLHSLFIVFWSKIWKKFCRPLVQKAALKMNLMLCKNKYTSYSIFFSKFT